MCLRSNQNKRKKHDSGRVKGANPPATVGREGAAKHAAVNFYYRRGNQRAGKKNRENHHERSIRISKLKQAVKMRDSFVETEHCLEVSQRCAQIRGAEENPACGNHKNQIKVLERTVNFTQKIFQAHSFRHQKGAVKKAPKEKGPVCAMPETDKGEDEQHVEICPRFAPAVSAQRNIEVIAEPKR